MPLELPRFLYQSPGQAKVNRLGLLSKEGLSHKPAFLLKNFDFIPFLIQKSRGQGLNQLKNNC